MAIAQRYQTQLRLIQQHGVDIDTGQPIYKTRTYNNIKESATAAQLLAVATAITGLQKFDLARLERRDDLQIVKA
ncbi:DUF1659 domain-containing protein [Aciduricibacillus chroicocephali]|uniref:DUF1659 domain-containing protein n=1 Tax=Aciduricibacillus chroicocephali TaxID=3054939 RepID=A0ABY9KTI0_9BACI|nr:DUF1659 domain-containing protein [Bacillaceae bacterium 44XB]